MALTQSKRKFINHCKSLVLGSTSHCPTFLEFFNSLPGDNSEISQGTCIDMLNSIEFVPESDLLFDPAVDKFAQAYIDLAAGLSAPRVKPAPEAEPETPKKAEPRTEEAPKAKTEEPRKQETPKSEPKKAKTRSTGPRNAWSTWVDKFIRDAGITDQAIIDALRSEEVAALYKGKQHCYVTLACRCKLLDLYRSTGNEACKAWAFVKSNKKTFTSIKTLNWFNVADLV